jgi:capsular exopolysaccharide synthesis family protein
VSASKGVLQAGIKEILSQNLGALAGVQGSLVSATENHEVHTILVTSSNRGEGKTVTAIGMAYSLASQGNAQVLLVDGNFAAPTLHECFAIPRQPGLSEFLTTEIGLEDVVCPTDDPRVMILPNGGSRLTLFDITRGQSFLQRLASLKAKFDYVIWDGSAVFSSSDASVVASLFDGVLLVVECERTRWEVVQDAKERLTKAGGKLLGVALNRRRYYIPKAIYSGG